MGTPKKSGNKLGRPRIEIDWNQVDAMCAIHCTGPEIASVIGVSEDTMTRSCKRDHDMLFAEYIEQKRGPGKVSLRRKQWNQAAGGDRTMLIWLGKNWLEQTDRLEHGGGIKTESTVLYLPKNGRE